MNARKFALTLGLLLLNFQVTAQTWKADFSAPTRTNRPMTYQVYLEVITQKNGDVGGSMRIVEAACKDPAQINGKLRASRLTFAVEEDVGLKGCGGWRFRGEMTAEKIEGELLWFRDWRPIVFKRDN